jgi:peptide/nickel transport system substrate-binding protein
MNDFDDLTLSRRRLLGVAGVGAGSVMLAGCGSGGGSSNAAGSSAGSALPTKRGGTFRFGTVDGSTSDSVDPAYGDNTYTNTTYTQNLFDQLVRFDDKTGGIQLHLAESVEPAPDLSYWTVRLNKAEFSNGKPITADDVIYTIQRTLNPKTGAQAATVAQSIDAANLKKLDSRTVRINLHYPDAGVPYELRQQGFAIIPTGFDPKKPIGSGPFQLQSFTAGQRGVLVRNDNYWVSGRPFLDQLEIVDFSDPGTTRINAFTSGQIDGANQIAYELVPGVEGASGIGLLISPSFNYNTFEMRMDKPPFDDTRVRQAIMLVADREQIVQHAFSGSRFAVVGNDLPSHQDPMFDHSVAQRKQDIEQAKSLLKAAGRENLTIELVVSNLAPGVVNTAQTLAQQANAAAGITININNIADSATYFTRYYFQAPFKFDYFPTYDIWEDTNGALVPGGSVNLSYWSDPEWLATYKKARGTPDTAERKALMAHCQQITWERGTRALFAYYRTADAFREKFTGFYTSAGGRGLNGLHFETVGMA